MCCGVGHRTFKVPKHEFQVEILDKSSGASGSIELPVQCCKLDYFP